MRFRLLCFLILLPALALASPARPDTYADLARGFARPPDSARPWVYWFWLNGNITREGITADLQAMKRVGIGGVLIMEVDQGVPRGPVDFVGPRWRDLFKHVVAEAKRLGIEVNMNNDAGWNGSGGPWIKPEQSMQKVVWTETAAAGGRRFEGVLARPPAVAGFYRDIAVLAVPAAADFRIPNIEVKSALRRDYTPPTIDYVEPPASRVIPRSQVFDLTERMSPDGRLVWDAPPGNWTVLRFGHTSTGMQNQPASESGRGLECDKLSREGIDAHFAGMMERLISDVGPAAGKTLAATHVDSWENGSQNWTARMREEFRRLRGYDLTPFLPVMTGRVVESLRVSERFLWDLRQTIGDLVVTNYAGRLKELANAHGLKLTIEAYDGPCDDMTYAGRADEPMSEFWIGEGAWQTGKSMASAAHTYGKRILGAEAFTADHRERWLEHPGSIKALGDRAFCEGINRFVFHRYAMQPWLAYAPGMTMGPWGIHYERTNTWWELSRPWHEYLARCQHLLRQGLFVADICYLHPEASPQGAHDHPRKGYEWDSCSPEVVLTRMTVKDGRITLPDGMSYRLLVLPNVPTMTPALLRKVRDLVAAGATIMGAPPRESPSLSGYPGCDAEVRQLVRELWGDEGSLSDRVVGKGRVLGRPRSPEEALAEQGIPPDFTGGPGIRWIHRRDGDTDIYFVASGSRCATESVCAFRVAGKRPELWDPETGRTVPAPAFEESGGVTRIPLRFEPAGSLFVIFRPRSAPDDSVVRLLRDGRSVWMEAPPAGIRILSALWGPAGDAARTKDVTDQVRRLVDAGTLSFQVAALAAEGDPAVNVVKTLRVEYEVGDRRLSISATDPETASFEVPADPEPPVILHAEPSGRLNAQVLKSGEYAAITASGRSHRFTVSDLPEPVLFKGPWEVRFPADLAASEKLNLESLVSWSELAGPGVRYFSGTAAYITTLDLPHGMKKGNRRLYLDLGRVEVVARVTLNGRDLGILWKPPYRVDITGAARAGRNRLEIQVTNLPINRMIGDEQLPEDSARNPDGTLKEWPKWVLDGKPSPTGRRTFTTWRLWKRDDRLLPSGLLGPVRIVVSESVRVR